LCFFSEDEGEVSDKLGTSQGNEQASDRLSDSQSKEIQAKVDHYEGLLKRVSNINLLYHIVTSQLL